MRGLSQFCDRNEWRQNTHSGRGICRRGSPVIAMLLLAGCSLAPVIAENTLDYNTAVETVTNGVLVSNIFARPRWRSSVFFRFVANPRRGAAQFAGANHAALRSGVSRRCRSLGARRAARRQQPARLRRRAAEHKEVCRRHTRRYRREGLRIFHSTPYRCQGVSQPRRQPCRTAPLLPGCVFRRSRPVIPSEGGRLYRLKPAGDSDDPCHLPRRALVSTSSSGQLVGWSSSLCCLAAAFRRLSPLSASR